MVPGEIIRAMRYLMAHRIVSVFVKVGVREGVVSEELQSLREALFYLDLQSVVVSAGIVAVIVPQIIGDTGTGVVSQVGPAQRSAQILRIWLTCQRVRNSIQEHRNRVNVVV